MYERMYVDKQSIEKLKKIVFFTTMKQNQLKAFHFLQIKVCPIHFSPLFTIRKKSTILFLSCICSYTCSSYIIIGIFDRHTNLEH